MTVVITVHAYVFYSLYVVNGATLMEVNHASGVLAAIARQGGVYMLGRLQRLTKGNIKTTTKWTVNLTENAARLHKRAAFLRDRERRKTYPRAGLK